CRPGAGPLPPQSQMDLRRVPLVDQRMDLEASRAGLREASRQSIEGCPLGGRQEGIVDAIEAQCPGRWRTSGEVEVEKVRMPGTDVGVRVERTRGTASVRKRVRLGRKSAVDAAIRIGVVTGRHDAGRTGIDELASAELIPAGIRIASVDVEFDRIGGHAAVHPEGPAVPVVERADSAVRDSWTLPIEPPLRDAGDVVDVPQAP